MGAGQAGHIIGSSPTHRFTSAWAFRPGRWTSDELPVGVAPEMGESMWATAAGFTGDELQTMFLGARVTSATERLGLTVGLNGHPGVRQFVQPLGIEDYHALSVVDGDGNGVVFAGASVKVVRLSRQEHEGLERIASHLLAALRLRSALARVDAVLTPGGRIVHAEAEAQPFAAQEALKASVVAFDRAHARAGTRDPDQAVEAWGALVAGRWSIVQQFDTDGRRYLVARRNEPRAIPSTALTPIESHALLLRAQGVSYKGMRYELGLSESTLHRYVHSGLNKLGLSNNLELAQFFGTHAQALLDALKQTPTKT